MQKSIKTISKRVVSIILAIMMIFSMMLVCMVTTNAMTFSQAYIYFDNTTAQWSNVYLVVGKNDYSSVYQMNKIDGTNLYYLRNENWDGATYLSFVCTSGAWGSGNWGPSNLSNATYYTTAQEYGIDYNNTYIAKPSSPQAKNVASNLSYYDNGYNGANNRTITLGTKIDGVTTTSTKPATLTIKSYSMTGNGTAASSSTTGGTYTAAPGASTTLSYSGLSSDYKFLGWVNASGTTVSTSSTYTFNANSTTNQYYANFTKNSYTVSAKARVQTYNFTTGIYNAIADASASQGTATANPTTVTPGSSTTLTATAGLGYEFAGWFTSSACTGNAVSPLASYELTPTASTTYYALFKQIPETKTLTIESIDDALITVSYGGTTYEEGSTATIPVGATVTVNVTGIATGKYCSSVKAGSVTATGSGSTFTFSMPASDAKLEVTIADKVPATVTVKSNDNTLGTASASPSTGVYVGDTITLTATPKNGSFSKWTISGATLNSGYSATSATVKVTVTGNVTATANFEEKSYVVYLSNGTEILMKESSIPGTYISVSSLANETVFTIKNAEGKYALSGSPDYWLNSSNPTDQVNGWGSSNSQNYSVRLNDGNKYVVYQPSNGTYGTVSLSSDSEVKFKIYAKNGTIRYQSDASFTTTADAYGATTVTGAGTGSQISPGGQGESGYRYTLYSAENGTNIKITTTVASSYDKVGYYVWAFCVNGKYVEATRSSGTSYVGTYTLNYEEAVNNCFEITPIYLNKNIEDNGDYITFYFDAGDVTGRWGQTVAVYPYAQGEDAPFEDYPGQPLVLRDKYYTIMVPRVVYDISISGGTIKKTNSLLDGLTISAYTGDNIHHQILYGNDNLYWSDGTNFQTYDFADFIKLAEDPEIKTIMFESKYFPSDAKNNGAVCGTDVDITVPSGGWDAVAVNPFETFTDYYGTPTDVLGNILSDDDKDKDPIYIISEGNKDTSNSSNATVGQWATKWYIYDHNGNYLTSGTPADFIGDTSYSEANRSSFINRPTYISYDREKTSSVANDTGIRSDGRWYYSRLGMQFKSSVAIEYIDAHGSDITLDENDNADNNDGFVGKVTDGSRATINGCTVAEFTTVDSTPKIFVEVADGWSFEGWFIREVKDDGTVVYTSIGQSTTLTTFIMNNSYTIVARLKEIPAGSIVLAHSQYTGSNPAYHTGTGDYYISAVVKDTEKNILNSFTDSKTAITIENLRADYTIEITLRTVCHGDNTFYAWYEADNGQFFEIAGDEDPRGKSEVSYTFTLDADKLFDINDKLVKSSLDFYSDIIKVSAFCDITYIYDARYDMDLKPNTVHYVVRNVELSLEEIENNYTPSYETISKYAPSVDTMYIDTKWELNSNTVKYPGRSVAEVKANQVPKQCKVYAPDFDSINGDPNDKNIVYNKFDVSYNSWFTDNSGDFALIAPETIGDYTFTRWEVYRLDAQGYVTDELVTVLSTPRFTLRIMADYKIVPVYSKTPDRITTHITAPVFNREVFGDSTNPTDRLYVDFLVAFTSQDVPVFSENETEYSVECGIIVDRNNDLALSDSDRAAIIAAAESNSANPLNIDTYKAQFGTNYDEISRVAFDNQIVDKDKVTYDDTNGNEHRLTKYVLDNNQLTNKNRIDKVLVYTNNEANQNYIFAAYSYVIIRDVSGNVIASAITTQADAQFYNLCYTGHMPESVTA